jgi:hypothetical protein
LVSVHFWMGTGYLRGKAFIVPAGKNLMGLSKKWGLQTSVG